MARLSTHTNPTTPKSIDDVVSSLSPLREGRERYYKLIDVREAISSSPEDDLLVGDGIYVTLFCVTPEGTYELYWYDYGSGARIGPGVPIRGEERWPKSETTANGIGG